MQAVIRGVRAKFADVSHLTTGALSSMLADKTKRVCLLDCRSQAEFDVGHLKDANRVNPALTIEEAKSLKIPHDCTDVVCYCAVGVRSSGVARVLQQSSASLTPKRNIYNLEGSIFKWANEERPMVDKQGFATRFVHPVSEAYEHLVNDHIRKFPES